MATLVLAMLGLYTRAYPSPIPAGTFSSTTSSVSPEHSQWYEVSRVVDGDTLVLLMQNKKTTVRLIGLDTPEVVDPRKPVQCFGREASAYMKQLVAGKQVRIEKDASQGEYDKYNRLLVYVFLPDGTNINEYMIAQGYGHEYTYRFPYTYQAAFKQAETEAREAQRGLWAPDACAAS